MVSIELNGCSLMILKNLNLHIDGDNVHPKETLQGQRDQLTSLVKGVKNILNWYCINIVHNKKRLVLYINMLSKMKIWECQSKR
jgi:hypothetical protein